MKVIWIIIGFILCLNINVFAQDSPPLSVELESLLPIDIFPKNSGKEYVFVDESGSKKPSVFSVSQLVGNSLPVFTAEVFSTAPSHYNVSVTWKNSRTINKGDALLARFTMRTIYAKQESGEGNVSFFLQTPKPAYIKSVILPLATGPEWKIFDIPFEAKENMAAGEAEICISFGALPQKVEITGLQVLNFQKKITVDKLPTTRFSYGGREADAPWRVAALKNIEEIRTAPLVIKVVDSLGQPVSGAAVEANLALSDFIWGTAVNESMLAYDSPDSEKYKAGLKELFNTGVIENGLKSPRWTNNPKRKAESIRAFEWLEQNDFRQRGHNLVWPGWKFNSEEMKALAETDSVTFKNFIDDEFRDKIAYTKGRVIAWDVINEIMHERDFLKYLPGDIVVQWFRLAKELEPDAQLFINDYGVLNSIASPQNIRDYIDSIAHYRSMGAPIEAIGAQGHVGRQPRDPALVISDLDIFATSGLPVQITEFDINSPDEELQADYTRDFLIACYSHPNVTGLTIWGFWEGKQWKEDAAMFHKDWTPKPNLAVWREYVTGKWKTSISEATDSTGMVDANGHLGKYQISVTYGDKVVKVDYQLTKAGEPVVVEL
jgi:endo-1,4-beta-xylanase